MRTICPFLVAIALCPAATSNAAEHDRHGTGQATFTLWQLPEQTNSQMMSYVIRGTGGKVIVIDGGTAGDAPYLQGSWPHWATTCRRGLSPTRIWITSGALGEILPRPQGLTIGSIYGSMPEGDWVAKHVPRRGR